MTYEQLQIGDLPNTESTPQQLPSSPQGSRANPTALREKVEAIVTAVTCGEKLQECSASLDRAGSSVKILPVYSQEKISGISDECLMTLPRWGIALGGEYGELVTSERRTNATECSLWLTPAAMDGRRTELPNSALANHWIKHGTKTNLAEQIAYQACYPTPQATSWGCSGAREKLRKLQAAGEITETERKQMQAGNGGKLNPTWVEWLIGLPLGWTDLGASETQ